MSKVTIKSLDAVISQELTIYSDSITTALKKQAQKSIKQLVQKTKKTAPVGKRHHHYKDDITSRKLSETDRGVTYQWYVKGANYRLSHLLENGHATRNGGRTQGTGFIRKAELSIVEDYQKKVEEIIKNGK